MKIVIWCPYVSVGGGVRLLQQLAPAIARHPEIELARLAIVGGKVENASEMFRGLELFQLSERRERGARSWLEREGRIFGIKGTGRLKAAARNRLFGTEAPNSWQHEQLRQAAQDCDLIYCFWPHRVECPQVDKPIACTYQDCTLIDFPEMLGGLEAKRLKDITATWLQGSTVILSSQATKDNLTRLFGRQCESAPIIHHAILPEDNEVRSDQHTELLEKLPRDYVVFPAHPSSSKNHHTLLVAWTRFERRRENPLVLFGPHTELLKRQPDDNEVAYNWGILRLLGQITRDQLRLGEDFYVLGNVGDKDVLPLIRNAKALIMPTLAEGGGSYPVEEALAVGTPVLCSDIPVMREHLRSRTAKIAWFDPNSADSIHSALDALFDNYDTYKESAIRGASDPRPTWDDIATQYVQVFKELLT
ncbi:MAG: glycosyltransferase [Pyrinomonadaceae bacterium]